MACKVFKAIAVFLPVCGVVLASAAAGASVYYVNNMAGNDNANGLQPVVTAGGAPLATVNAALARAKAGDEVRLVNTGMPYRQRVDIYKKDGAEGSPIVVDGNGAVLYGSAPLVPGEWAEVSPGLYRSNGFKCGDPHRLFFIYKGRMNRMGKTIKGSINQAYPADPALLKPGEWTCDSEKKTFYVRLAPGDTLECMEFPVLLSGVAINNSSWIVVRNVKATRFWNDGFGLGRDTKHIRLENVEAYENGDDGISAHQNCEVDVDGMISWGNSTGMCHVDASCTTTRNFFAHDNFSFDIYYLGSGRHTLENASVLSSSINPFYTGNSVTVEARNVQITYAGSRPKSFVVDGKSGFAGERVAISGLSVKQGKDASLTLKDSLVEGDSCALQVFGPGWHADRNGYGVSELSYNGRKFAPDAFAEYVKESGQDGASVWRALSPAK